MPDFSDPQVTRAIGMVALWAIAAAAIYCAVLETYVLASTRQQRRDLDEWGDHYDELLAAQERRLERIEGRPTRQPTTVIAVDPATDVLPAVRRPSPRTRHAADVPTPAQQTQPTRPDFRAQPKPVPPEPYDPLAPTFVAPGQASELPAAHPPRGRHAAHD